MIQLLSLTEVPLEVDLSERRSNCRVWARYSTPTLTFVVNSRLDNSEFFGLHLTSRVEPGMDSSGKRIVNPASHSTEIRKVSERNVAKQKKNKPKSKKGVSYSYRSIYVGEEEYPFPSGLYLTRLLTLTQA